MEERRGNIKAENEMNINMKEEQSTLDWRGRPSNPNKHGDFQAASFVLGLQAFEIMAIAAVGNKLITYVINEMHFSLSNSANIVTNFVGTIFLLALLGGYLSDSFLGSFWTMLIFGFVELSGLILLSVQAHVPQLKPPKCNMVTDGEKCEEAKGVKCLIFFVALYLVALGSGCVKPNMIAHGADQFNIQTKKLSTYFNAAYFAFSVGELFALTLLIWIQTHAAILKRKQICPSNPNSNCSMLQTQRFRNVMPLVKRMNYFYLFFQKLLVSASARFTQCGVKILSIFGCTIVFNTILAQLQTFSVQQGSAMDTQLTNSFHIPPASLQSIPYIMLIFILPLYHKFFVPFATNITGHESGISPLQRIGSGLFLATFSMISAALLEKKRRESALHSGKTISIFWITPQFLIFGLSEMLTAVGLIEFFYKQSLNGMQATFTAITYCSYSFGFYLSSVLVSLVNKITSASSNAGGWLSYNDLNKNRLDLFYWLLAVLSFLNFLNYLFWARWHSHHSSPPPQPTALSKDGGYENIP
ncbi:hypothetical protein ES319_D06G177100v1 [Gossypium barbadense]|uniref:Major facilitator superfamily (MFS) profile domain-containing protein n=1 Tax=Gossypium barbadense TaxID=3634 RepID=A0A5J5R4P4_GOSBA|nr:hypothetical protein ES319_D06G177100v1 [Gossypium barbadense]